MCASHEAVYGHPEPLHFFILYILVSVSTASPFVLFEEVESANSLAQEEEEVAVQKQRSSTNDSPMRFIIL
tara:strand:+ start:151 stop:363 length:213 start_codon:yes stop_codon:yes gene_type:complete